MNNIQHLKYAVEVEKTGRISKAAQNMYMSQPHLSKAIRDLEDSLGFSIFNRTSRGVLPTKKGAEFLGYAKSILSQIEEMEALYHPFPTDAQRFDISVPRASYISLAFTEFIKELDHEKDMHINYCETNSTASIKNVADGINNLAIIRYQSVYEQYFLNALAEHSLSYRPILEFAYMALMSSEHPLAKEKTVDINELLEYTELVHGDITVPALPVAEARKINRSEVKRKTISLYERGSQFELLSRIHTTYIWVSPMPQDVLSRFSLVQRPCNMSKNKYKDILIYRNGYKFTEEDSMFAQKLKETIDMVSRI